MAGRVRPVADGVGVRVGDRELDEVRRDLRQHLGLVDRVGVGQVAPVGVPGPVADDEVGELGPAQVAGGLAE